jgi:hypothetical protein
MKDLCDLSFRHFITLIILVYSNVLVSQNRPVWRYKSIYSYNHSTDTILSIYNEKDTIINGHLCQKMRIENPNDYGAETISYFYTFEENKRIFEGISNTLLYDFNAEKGDFWYIENGTKIVVDSVSFLAVDGRNLKQLHVSYLAKKDLNGFNYDYKSIITEKLGDHTYYINRQSNFDPDASQALYLMSYQDENCSVKLNFEQNTINKGEPQLNKNLTFYPNPVKDNLFLGLEDGFYFIEILSIDNTLIYSENIQIKNHEAALSFSNLAQGLYILKVKNDYTSFVVE